MERYYEINVSLNGKHYFATAPRSIKTQDDYRVVYGDLVRRFPAKEGYKISGTLWECSGKPLTLAAS